ncbi:hypothetical protein [Sphingomonas immobilis]|uniref:Zinc/iron-chelating domain-containing protein n=1 Tax=Sphingomonas immobilis TaxID=3063997 RepID=A0ABT8ZTE1_9SPHN|nr:hypothetical protein [Sphingomonas sp. CA1-15]MDO7840821.1 hypothetical protein [Sphingomonas sp. CA1-15]
MQTRKSTDVLVPGRDCGACTACCTDLTIMEGGIDKPAGLACEHCIVGGGCAIYETRFSICRDYHCVWRSMPGLDDSWRPDRSGVLIVWGTPPYGYKHAVDLLLIGPPETLESERFIGLAAAFVERGILAVLALPRGPGLLTTSVPINDLLRPAIEARNLTLAQDLLRSAHDQMLAMPAEADPRYA